MDEVGGFLEAAIDAGKADVGDFVELAEFGHDAFADGGAGDFAFEFVGEVVDDAVDEVAAGGSAGESRPRVGRGR